MLFFLMIIVVDHGILSVQKLVSESMKSSGLYSYRDFIFRTQNRVL